ncbi:hypothetical protein ACMFMG_006686 [Clarireedia jacksonii]
MLPRRIIAIAAALLIHLSSVISNNFSTSQNGLQVLGRDSQQSQEQASSQQSQQDTNGNEGQQQINAQQSQKQQSQSQQVQTAQHLQAQQSQGQSRSVAGGQCFFPNGSPDSSGIPCFTDDDTSRCCGQDEICSTNKLCVAKKDPNKFTRRSCVDKTFQSGDCPIVCQGGEYRSKHKVVDVLPCGDSSLGQFCCDEGQEFQCCSIPEKVLTLGKSNSFNAGAPAASASGLTQPNQSAANSNKDSSSTQVQTSQAQTSRTQQSQSQSSQPATSQIQTPQSQTTQVVPTQTQVLSATQTIVRTSVSIQIITSQVPPQAPPSVSTSIVLVTSIQAITSTTDVTSTATTFTSAQQSFDSQKSAQASGPGALSNGSIYRNHPLLLRSHSHLVLVKLKVLVRVQIKSDQSSNQQNNDSNTGSPAAIIGGSVIGGTALLGILTYAIYFSRKRASRRSSTFFESSLGNTNLSDGKPFNIGFQIISDTYPTIKEKKKSDTQHLRSNSAPSLDYALQISMPIVNSASSVGSQCTQNVGGGVRNEEGEGGRRDPKYFF